MESPLYNSRILRLAASVAGPLRLEAPHASACSTSQVCGSSVRVDLALDAGGRVAAFAQEVKACALGQASAAVLARAVHGLRADQLLEAHGLLKTWLEGDGTFPAGLAAFADLEHLAPARAYPGRHPAILLAFDAAARAAAMAAAPAGER